MRTRLTRHTRRTRRIRSKKGGLFGVTNRSKTPANNRDNFVKYWNKDKKSVYDPTMNYPGATNPFARPSFTSQTFLEPNYRVKV